MDRTVAHVLSRLRMVLIYLIVIYLLAGVLLYLLQDRIIFLGETLDADYQFEFETPFEEHLIETSADGKINALHFKADSTKGLIIYFHGNAGSLARWGLVAEDYVRLGYDVAIMDYRGYGKSTGPRCQQTLLSDAEAVYDFFRDRYRKQQLILYGRSIGTGMASYVAGRRNPDKLILETPFYDFQSLARSVMPIFPVSLALRYTFSNVKYLKDVGCPVFLFHGTDDSVIPYHQATRLFAERPATEMQLFTIQGGDHNNLGEYPQFWTHMRAVLP